MISAGLAPSLLLIRSDQNHGVEQKKTAFFLPAYASVLLPLFFYRWVRCEFDMQFLPKNGLFIFIYFSFRY